MVGPLGNLLTMRAAAHLPRWLVLAATSAGWVVPMRQCGEAARPVICTGSRRAGLRTWATRLEASSVEGEGD